MSERVSPFEATKLDLTGFTPQPPTEKVAVERVRKVAEQANFTSREPEKKKPKRKPRQYRTGRDTQFNIKADQSVIEVFYQIAEQQNWVLGETLEQAVEALKKQLGKPAKNS